MAVFLIVCLLPSLGMLILPAAPVTAHQTLAPVPRLQDADGHLNPHFLQEVTDYTADHFAFRQELITCRAKLKALLFRSSASEDVLLGKDGWLFYRETADDVLRTAPLSERQLWAAAHTLSLTSEYAAGQGARLLFTVAPNKASLYPQYLPPLGTPLSETADVERLLPLLEAEGVPYVDLFHPFRLQPETQYYQLDSHWNTRGAALAADTLLEALGQSGGFFGGHWTAVRNHRGDLYEMLYPAGKTLDTDFALEDGFHFSYVSDFHSPEDQYICTALDRESGSLLMYRDSFGNALYPFLAERFASAAFSRSMPWQLSLLDAAGADTVLIEIVERNLDWLATRPPIFPAPERFLNGVPPVGEAAASFRVSDDGLLAGCLRVEGNLIGDCDANSPIYVQWGGTLYEACPAGGSWEEIPFTLYVPSDGEPVQLLYQLDGNLLAAKNISTEAQQ